MPEVSSVAGANQAPKPQKTPTQPQKPPQHTQPNPPAANAGSTTPTTGNNVNIVA